MTAEGVAKATAATLLVFVTFFLQGCRPFPEQEVKEAKRAAHLAFRARAPLYAPESWKSVKKAESELDDEIWKQTGRLISDNERVGRLAAKLQKLSKQALKEAKRGESAARDRAEKSIAKADALLWSSRFTAGPIQPALKRKLSLLLDQARADMNAGNYIEAGIRAGKVISAVKGQESALHCCPK